MNLTAIKQALKAHLCGLCRGIAVICPTPYEASALLAHLGARFRLQFTTRGPVESFLMRSCPRPPEEAPVLPVSWGFGVERPQKGLRICAAPLEIRKKGKQRKVNLPFFFVGRRAVEEGGREVHTVDGALRALWSFEKCRGEGLRELYLGRGYLIDDTYPVIPLSPDDFSKPELQRLARKVYHQRGTFKIREARYKTSESVWLTSLENGWARIVVEGKALYLPVWQAVLLVGWLFQGRFVFKKVLRRL